MRREDVDFVQYAEHPVRELDIACILRHLLRRDHGLRMEVVPLRFRDYEILYRYNPRVIGLSAFFHEEEGFYRHRHYWPNAHFANLAYEQVFQKVNMEMKAPRGEFAKTRINYSAWGEFYRDFLIGRGTNPDLIAINGNPSYALYTEPYRAYFPSREEMARRHGLDPGKRWVFIPENYHAAFFSEERIQVYLSVGETEETMRAFVAFAARSLQTVCEWLRDIPEDTEVIFRPRPATGLPKFMDKVAPWIGEIPKNLHITYEDTVREWILASDAVASSYSTTLIEAAVAGKPIFMLAPHEFPDFVLNPWYEHVDDVTTVEEFRALLDGSTSHGDSARLAEWTRKTMMGDGDPIQKIVEWLVELHRRQGQAPREVEEPVVRRRALQARMRGLNRDLRKKILRQKEKSPMHDWIDDKMVDDRTAAWARVLG